MAPEDEDNQPPSREESLYEEIRKGGVGHNPTMPDVYVQGQPGNLTVSHGDGSGEAPQSDSPSQSQGGEAPPASSDDE